MATATRLFSRRGVIHQATYHARRGIVVSSVEPPLDVPIERPERIVLAESSLYESSWVECAASFFPSNGLHFVAIDIHEDFFLPENGHYDPLRNVISEKAFCDPTNVPETS